MPSIHEGDSGRDLVVEHCSAGIDLVDDAAAAVVTDACKPPLQLRGSDIVQHELFDARIALVFGRVGFENAIPIDRCHVANLKIAGRPVDPENAIAEIVDGDIRIALAITNAVQLFSGAVDAHRVSSDMSSKKYGAANRTVNATAPGISRCYYHETLRAC